MKGTKVQTFFKIMMAMIFRIKTHKYWISNIIKIKRIKIRRNMTDMKVKIAKR